MLKLHRIPKIFNLNFSSLPQVFLQAFNASMSSYSFRQYIHQEINDKETMGMAPSHDFFFSSTSLHLLFSISTSVAAPPPPQGRALVTSSQVVLHWDLGA
jgi:hypothetical protein